MKSRCAARCRRRGSPPALSLPMTTKFIQLARSWAASMSRQAGSAALVSPRSRSPGEGFSPFASALPAMPNPSDLGLAAPPWLIVGPPLCFVMVELLSPSRTSEVRGSSSDLHLAAHLDDSVGRQAEEFHRAFGVPHHPGEQLLAPDRHAADV